MLIVGDESNQPFRIPWVTWGLIAVNVLVFALQSGFGAPFEYGFSLIPAEITQGRDLTRPEEIKIRVPLESASRRQHHGRPTPGFRDEWVRVPQYPGPIPIYLTLLTSLFLHANVVHLLGNLWFLFVFGDNIEHALRPARFLGFYLICGVAAGLAHVLIDPHSVIPCMGASGAISGVLGAYVSIYPLNKVKIWLGWWYGVLEVPALVVLGLWFLLQYLNFALEITYGDTIHGGVAYGAHLGGFVTGLLYIWGLILYLKWQTRDIPNPGAGIPEQVEPQGIDDPYGSFLPAVKHKDKRTTDGTDHTDKHEDKNLVVSD